MAARKRESEREPLATKPETDRNEALAALAAKGAVLEDAAERAAARPVSLPYPTGRVHDLGGSVEAVLITPWAVIDEVTVFRGDHVKASAELVDSHDGLVRL